MSSPPLEVVLPCWKWYYLLGSGLKLLGVVLPCWKSFGAVGSGITLLEVVGYHFEARLDIAPQIMQKREIAFKSVGQNAKVEVRDPSDHAEVRNHLQKCWRKCKNVTLFRQSPGNPNAVECGRVSISLYKNAVECGPGTNIDLIY